MNCGIIGNTRDTSQRESHEGLFPGFKMNRLDKDKNMDAYDVKKDIYLPSDSCRCMTTANILLFL